MDSKDAPETKTETRSETAEVVRVLGDIGLEYMRDRNREASEERDRTRKGVMQLVEGPLQIVLERLLTGGKGKRVVLFDEPEKDEKEPKAENSDTAEPSSGTEDI